MKKHSIFPGIILIGVGTYLLLQQLNISLFSGFFSWTTLIIIIGIALLVQAYSANDHSQILPGVILTGFGFHFHPINTFSFWPDHFGMLVFIVALGLILKSLKTKSDHSQGFLLLAFALLLLNYDAFLNKLGALGSGLSFIIRYWPVIIIAVGIYLLFIKKK
ncbi:LiaI-LiaF-like domain-containing protein [Litchfieldia salsa]|uniref:LiaI-LiaF-like transmembrane region domain-containing protein n=1 Tax=Litchfieldia salsa TaxID=930152 RepID=A0A1H0NW29_9BACI|nr:DUF5668 domain-containing protein [Litchfieldia salsa]SDO96728.1 hypothetical protein SAMN05216565_10139 [Litchfieldia salsa]